MMLKEDVKAIEKELDLKTIKAFLKTLDLLIEKKITIPNIRAYAQDKSTGK